MEEDKAMEAVETEVLDESNVVKLKKPLADGRTEIVLNFDKLTGAALIMCERKTRQMDKTLTFAASTIIYSAHLAAVAAGMPYAELLKMPAPDFSAVLAATQRFLGGMEE